MTEPGIPANDTRHSMEHSFATARDAAGKAVDRTRDGARDVVRRTTQSIESSPMSVLIGGLAVGALAGALLPRSEKEGELLSPVGRKINDAAGSAAKAARDAGKAELDTLGLNKTAARDQATRLVDGVFKALASAGNAAAEAPKKRR